MTKEDHLGVRREDAGRLAALVPAAAKPGVGEERRNLPSSTPQMISEAIDVLNYHTLEGLLVLLIP